MKRTAIACVLCLSMIVLSRRQSDGQVSVTTWHNDNWRTGQNTTETQLKLSSFNNHGFGLRCKIILPSSPQQEQAGGPFKPFFGLSGEVLRRKLGLCLGD